MPERAAYRVERERRQHEKKIMNRQHVPVFCVQRRLHAEIIGRDDEQNGERAILLGSDKQHDADDDERQHDGG